MRSKSIRKLIIRVSSVLLACAVISLTSAAQVPKKINYQGYLTNAGGTVITGATQMTFTIYDAAGTQAWTEAQTVAVSNGRYSVMLGAVNPMNLTEAKPYYLGVKVGADQEMTPRQEITGSLYDVIQGNTVSGGVWSQAGNNIYYNNGNVGVGTTNPLNKLHVIAPGGFGGGEDANGLSLASNVPLVVQSNSTAFGILNAAGRQAFALNIDGDASKANMRGIPTFYDKFDGSWHPSLSLKNGNVGIGTANPSERLTVYTPGGSSPVGAMSIDVGTFSIPTNAQNSYFFRVRDLGYTTLFYIRGDGNVGIGTTNPTYKLSVNGSIRAKEILVDTNWADFVFDKNYQLMPLNEVEQHITAEKHLPGIPSAQEVAANGVSLGDMQAKQLQKIEELTLYVIQMNKQLTAVQQENESLKAKVSTLEQAAGK